MVIDGDSRLDEIYSIGIKQISKVSIVKMQSVIVFEREIIFDPVAPYSDGRRAAMSSVPPLFRQSKNLFDRRKTFRFLLPCIFILTIVHTHISRIFPYRNQINEF